MLVQTERKAEPWALFKADLLERWFDDPAEMGQDAFHQPPREWQPETLTDIRDNERTALRTCRRAGKTRAAAYAALWWVCTHHNSLVVTNAPTHRQIRESVWTEIRTLWYGSILPAFFPAWEMNLTFLTTDPKNTPQWRALGVGSDKPAKIEGMHAESVLMIYDEAKAIPRDIYESMQGMLAEVPWREFAISTPGIRSGWFYDTFTRNRAFWKTRKISAAQIPRLRPKYEAELARLGKDNPNFLQNWEAEFAGDVAGVIIPVEAIERAVNRELRVARDWRRVLGVDPAGMGQNETVVTGRYGPVVLRQWCWQGWREMETVGEVVKIFRAGHYDRVTIDATGLGGPMADRLAEVLGDEKVLRFIAGAQAPDAETYENLKTECVFGLRDRFTDPKEEGISIPDDGTLIGQLSSYISKTTSRGRTKVEDPPDSPDRADSLLIAFSDSLCGEDVAMGSPLGA